MNPTPTSTSIIDENSAASTTSQQIQIQIPYRLKAMAKLEAAFPMTEDDWSQMMAVLTAMKPGLVTKQKEHTALPETVQAKKTRLTED